MQVKIERLIAIAIALFLTYHVSTAFLVMTGMFIDNLFLVSSPKITYKTNYKVKSLEELNIKPIETSQNQSSQERMFTIKRSDGLIHEIPQKYLKKAIAMGGEVIEGNTLKCIGIRSLDGKEWDVPDYNLDTALARGGEVIMISSYKLDDFYRSFLTMILAAIQTLIFFVCALKLGEIILVKKEELTN